MANYRRIVGNWAANARAGRNRANQALQNEMKALEMEQKANLLFFYNLPLFFSI